MTPTLVLLPGLHGTAGLWGPLLAQMPAGIHCRMLEHPTRRACTYRGLRQRVEEQLGGESEMVLLAESFSGAMALQIAAAHPGRVRGVVLCASFVTPPVPGVFCFFGGLLSLAGAGVRLPAWAVRMFLAGSGGSGELVRDVQRQVRRVWPHALAFRVLQAAWIDGLAALAKCDVPVLVLAGGRDRLVGPRSVRRIQRAQRKKNVELKTIDGPHLLAQVRAAEVWREVEAFMERVRNPVSA